MADECLPGAGVLACGCVAAALSVEGVRASVRFTPQTGSCPLPRASLSLIMAFNHGTVLRARRKLGGHAVSAALVDAICRTDRLARICAHPQTRRDARYTAHDVWRRAMEGARSGVPESTVFWGRQL